MNSSRFVRYWLCVIGVLVTATFAMAGKPAPPPSLPVEYQLTDIGHLGVGYTNTFSMARSSSVTVGISGFGNPAALVWTEQMGIMDLNLLCTLWVDLNTNETVTGWTASKALDVNEAGQIVGTAEDGVSQRAFLFDPVAERFLLLPTPGGLSGNFQAFNINEHGDVLIRSIIDGNYNEPFQLLWTPSDPYVTHEVGIGDPAGLNNDKFLLLQNNVATLYSYHFLPDGTLVQQVIGSVSATAVSELNNVGWFGYRENNTTYGRIKICRPGTSTVTVYNVRGATVTAGAAISDSGDYGYVADNVPYLYRLSEGKSYKLYDLLDSTAKSILFPNGTFASRIGMLRFMVNSSNVAGVPTADPFDHMCGTVNLTADPSTSNWTTIVLTPVVRH
jgi:hypothetical protein